MDKHVRTGLITSVVVVGFFLSYMIYDNIRPPNPKDVEEEIKVILEDSDVTHYVKPESVEAKVGDKDFSNDYMVHISADVGDTFTNFSSKSRFTKFQEIVEMLEGLSGIHADGKFSEVQTLTLQDGENTYKYDDLSKEMTDFDNKVYTVLSFDEEPVVKEEMDPESERKHQIWAFMEAQYRHLTNHGENYDPELHDPMVARLASKKYGITPDEAANIYIEEAVSQGN